MGADVRSFESEAKMLLEWAEFLRECDPDIITGAREAWGMGCPAWRDVVYVFITRFCV